MALTIAAACCMAGPFPCQEKPEWNLQFQKAGVEGVIVVYDSETALATCSSISRATLRHSPASTFKILNSLIAFETNVVGTKDQVFPWDGTDRKLKVWNQSQDLKTAFGNSTVWVYQLIARQIGPVRMKQFLARTQYGKGRLRTVDQFWLNGEIKISALEQVNFLRELWEGRSSFSKASIRQLKEMMLEEEVGAYRLFGKTGWQGAVALPQASWIGFVGPKQIGWYIGVVEGRNSHRVFAMNLEMSKSEHAVLRKRIAISILKDAAFLP